MRAIIYQDKTLSNSVRQSGVAGEGYWLNSVLLSLCFLLVFVKLAGEVLSNELLAFDRVVTGYINLLYGPLMTKTMQGIRPWSALPSFYLR